MTVADLRAALEHLDPSLPVVVPGSGMADGAGVLLRHVLVRDRLLVDGRVEYCDTEDWGPEGCELVTVVSLQG